MKIGIGSVITENFEVNKNIFNIEKLMKKAGGLGAEYLFLGEAVLNGFSGLIFLYTEDIENHAVSRQSQEMERIQNLCIQYQIGLGIGYYEREDEDIYSSYIVINAKGQMVENYRRLSVGWKEPGFNHHNYREGNSFNVIEMGDSKCIIAICGDLWTQEVIDKMQGLDFDTIIWPLYIDYSIEEWEQAAKYEYLDQIKGIGKRTLLINSESHVPNGANGGLLEISSKGELLQEGKMLEDDLLLIKL